MDENYKLEKDYKVSGDLFRDAYYEFQKKYVLKKSYVYAGLFFAMAVIFIFAAVKDSSNTLCYLLIAVCLAFAAREWYNPRKLRASLVETVKAMGEPVYRIGVADEFVDISTVEEPEYDDTQVDEGDFPEELDPLPEKTRLEINDQLEVLEYDRFFLLMQGKSVFYIIPKEGFTESDIGIVRGIGK